MKYIKNNLMWFVLAALTVAFFTINQDITMAQAPTPTATPVPISQNNMPIAIMHEAIGFTDINVPGDAFVLMRYQLQTSLAGASNTQWCTEVFLENDTGCELTPPNPEYPFSLREGNISAILWDGTTLDADGMPSPLQDVTRLPRIHHGLTGIYLDTGHGLNLASTRACFLYSARFETTYPTTTNRYGDWLCNQSNTGGFIDLAPGTGTTPGGIVFGDEISGGDGIVYNLNNALNLPENTLVSSAGLITPGGQTYLEEALKGSLEVARNSDGITVFQLGLDQLNRNFTPKGSNVALQTRINATATASGVTENLDIIADQYMGMDGMFFGGLVFLFLGLIAGGVVIAVTNNAVFGFIAALMLMLPGMFIGAFSVALVMVFTSIFIVFGSWYWIRRSPE